MLTRVRTFWQQVRQAYRNTLRYRALVDIQHAALTVGFRVPEGESRPVASGIFHYGTDQTAHQLHDLLMLEEAVRTCVAIERGRLEGLAEAEAILREPA